MLSTPPAFNLSQNQTLQFKSVQDSCFRRNRNLKDFLPTRYSLVNEPLWPLGPADAARCRSARGTFMFPFVSQVNNFFSFRESFSRRPSVVFLKARGAFMLHLAFEVNNFFPFRETFCFTVDPAAFLQSRGAIMLPFASSVNRFFSFPRIYFACVSVNRFPSSRGAFMLPPAKQVNHFFSVS